MSREMAALWSGVSERTIARWEQGTTRQPGPEDVEPLVKLYGRTALQVFQHEEPPPPEWRGVPAFHLVVHPKAEVPETIKAQHVTDVADWNSKQFRRAATTDGSSKRRH